MRRTLILSTLVAALAVGAGAATASAGQPAHRSTRANDCAQRDSRGDNVAVVGLVADGSLVCFQDNRPQRETFIGTLSGLQIDTSIVGIDYRPANNVLYGLGNAGGVYTIDTTNAAATLASRLDKPLSGTNFGVDFNPTVDRLRVVSDAGQNLRVNVDNGMTTVDTALNVPSTPPVNPALGVTAAAYTNNDADPATATTLFDLDAANDQIAIQAPPNGGALNPTGKLGVDANSPAGFDIYSSLRSGTTVDNRALASFPSTQGATTLYGIDLLTGRAYAVGSFDVPVADIAVPTDQR